MQRFADQLDTQFTAALDDGTVVPLTLVSVTDSSGSDVWESFSMMFRAPGDAPRTQSIFHLRHDSLDDVDLFLVPTGLTDEGLFYEAVINRLI